MPELETDGVRLRPIEEADLDALSRYFTGPGAAGEFERFGFRDPRTWRRRWEEDRWLGPDGGRLDTTPAHRLQAFTEAGNVAEQRALEKVGFEREGVRRAVSYRGGRWRDTVLYALLRT